MSTGPQRLAAALDAWALAVDWIEWVELGGSLGRGAGDELSDVDAGIGVTDLAEDDPRIGEALTAISGFAPVAATLRQRLGDLVHLVCVYRDGRQLSLVVFDAAARAGLPPQSTATVDKTGRLAAPLDPARWTPDAATRREWAFLAWIALGDAARHAYRAHPWRALRSLTEARDHLWQLHAAALGLPYPAFGAVTAENAEAEPPQGIEATHPATLTPPDLHRALNALAELLAPHTTPDLQALPAAIRPRLDLLDPSCD
ncbi:hypothetical protein [Glycomyces terrestris]|uniref:Nucleotidyltransferase domain-containing protein n=1 Tax=Glycomyces terrestris TaxID=2493553 RepID=A0A426UYN7_9ACTN|nr:hypothetical protein [Glycomyces terrestris]RRR99684.1 hypothetical protein EIW28_13465 [Glycomyces terrestris]